MAEAAAAAAAIAAQSGPLDERSFGRIAKALADPQRFALLERIAQGPEVACMALVAEFPITQATISHHLKELSRAGLVSTRREGKCCHFSVQRGVLARYQADLARRMGLEDVGRGRGTNTSI
jgi:ArsR family transcriptional regulator